MRIEVDRSLGLELYFIVKRWRPMYRKINEWLCDVSRPVSFAIVDEAMWRMPSGTTPTIAARVQEFGVDPVELRRKK